MEAVNLNTEQILFYGNVFPLLAGGMEVLRRMVPQRAARLHAILLLNTFQVYIHVQKYSMRAFQKVCGKLELKEKFYFDSKVL